MPPGRLIVQIRNSSDWRDALPFELPVAAAEAVPGEPTRCAGCGVDSEPWPREALWVVKHRHPTNPAGYVRYYCAEHKPTPKLAPPVSAPERARRAASSGPRKPDAASIPERAVVLCPDCFVQVPPTGVCGMCGQQVA
ncbi:glucose-6-phosphate dehydrogenase [Microbacterium lacticum]